MRLEEYFSLNPKRSTLSDQFNLPNLKPILVKYDNITESTFLLTDDENSFYLWNELNGKMFIFLDSKTMKLADIVELVTTDSYGGDDLEQQLKKRGARRQDGANSTDRIQLSAEMEILITFRSSCAN